MLNVVKCKLTQLTTKRCRSFHVFRSTMECFAFNIAVCSFIHMCTGSHRSMRSQCKGHLELLWESVVWLSFLAVVVDFRVFLIFLLPSLYTPFFPLLSHRWVPGCPCVGAQGWVVGIASYGSGLLSRSWLITVEAPGHPGHPPSTQFDAVVNKFSLTCIVWDSGVE